MRDELVLCCAVLCCAVLCCCTVPCCVVVLFHRHDVARALVSIRSFVCGLCAVRGCVQFVCGLCAVRVRFVCGPMCGRNE